MDDVVKSHGKALQESRICSPRFVSSFPSETMFVLAALMDVLSVSGQRDVILCGVELAVPMGVPWDSITPIASALLKFRSDETD